jgi:hypothetical protein
VFIPFLFENITLSLERKYYKANIISSKMKALKDEHDILRYKINTSYNGIIRNNLIEQYNEIGNKINKITDPKSMISHDVKISLYIFGFLLFFFLFYLLLISTEPKKLFLIHDEYKNWLTFFVILISSTSILIYKIIQLTKELKKYSIWIYTTFALALILFFTKPYFVTILSAVELFWYFGCCLFISVLSIAICKAFE